MAAALDSYEDHLFRLWELVEKMKHCIDNTEGWDKETLTFYEEVREQRPQYPGA